MTTPLAVALHFRATLPADWCVHIAEIEHDATEASQPHRRAGFAVVLVPTWVGMRPAVAVHWVRRADNEEQCTLIVGGT